MDLPKQKNFYDVRRAFQGKDQPTDAHPDAQVRQPFPFGHFVFGMIFLAAIGALAYASVKGARDQLVPTAAQNAEPASKPATK
jgi:hypothetical protein